MKMVYWHLVENPTGKTYEQLIQVLCEYADTFYFITRKELQYDEQVLAQFRPYVIQTYQSKSWAGTVTQGPPATIYIMKANENTCKLLQQLSNSLFDWVSPRLPEDLTFLKDGRDVFSSTTHEKMGCFELKEDEQYLLQQIEGLKLEN